jgi:gamma-glutamylaminecyclotransferase
MTAVFVYGTLRRGQRNHPQLRGAAFLGEATTAPRYDVIDLGPYPGLVAGTSPVAGEVWTVSAELLAALDAFEGVPTLYTRGPVELADGRPAHAYFWAGQRSSTSAIV